MTFKTGILGWHFHGESLQDDLIAGFLPSSGVHHLISDNKEASRAIAAEIVVAVAGGAFAGGLGA